MSGNVLKKKCWLRQNDNFLVNMMTVVTYTGQLTLDSNVQVLKAITQNTHVNNANTI